MKRKFTSLGAALALVGLAAPQFAHAVPAFAISQDGSSLLRFDTTNTTAATVGAFTDGMNSVLVSGIDFRASDGALYAYSQPSSSIYTVNPFTAKLTLVSSGITSMTGFGGIDFNPVPNALRIVNSADQNLRITPAAALNVVNTDTAFPANAMIADVAYTNNDNDAGTGTTIYYIDVGSDQLFTATNANTLAGFAAVGSLGVDTTSLAGFDILTSSMGVNTAYALLTRTGSLTSGLYTIDLATGAATLVGDLGVSGYGLAVALPNSRVPEPGTLGLLALAGVAGLAVRRRRV